MKIKDVMEYLEQSAPSAYQEDYDNSGLIVGDPEWEYKGSMTCLDSTEEVVAEAIRKGVNMIIAHHPILFKGLKRLNGRHYTERAVIKALKNDIAIYAIHTNLDNVRQGVNEEIADRIGLITDQRSILMPKPGILQKLEVLCPLEAVVPVQEAAWEAGAGEVGNYDRCSFSSSGVGRFRPNADANPHIGEREKDEASEEVKLEFLIPAHLGKGILNAVIGAHPYEEVAYFMSVLANKDQGVGSGLIGTLEEPLEVADFLERVKQTMKPGCIKYTNYSKGKIERVAVLGGSGIFGLEAARASGAQAFITSDIKYHEYFEADGNILLVDIGHYESEQYTQELIQRMLAEKFPTFANLKTGVNTNPVNYL